MPMEMKDISSSITLTLMRGGATPIKMRHFDVTFTLKRELGKGDSEARGPGGRGWLMAGDDEALGTGFARGHPGVSARLVGSEQTGGGSLRWWLSER